MYQWKLKENDIVDIYTDFKECIGYEGKAILRKKISNGDSFYLKDEFVKVGNKKLYTQHEIDKATKYKFCNSILRGSLFKKSNDQLYIKSIYKRLCSLRKNKVSDFYNINLEINRIKNENTNELIDELFRIVDNDFLIRFILQHDRRSNQTIFNYERWNIEFILEDEFQFPFITNRNIRIIKCVNPSEKPRTSDIFKFMTYNGKTSRDLSKLEEQDDFFENNEINDNLIM